MSDSFGGKLMRRNEFLGILAAGTCFAGLYAARGAWKSNRDLASPGMSDKGSGVKFRNVPVSTENRFKLEFRDENNQFPFLVKLCAPVFDSLKLPKLMHAFRLWGKYPGLTFGINDGHEDGWVLSGKHLQNVLLDHSVFDKRFPGETPILMKTDSGISVRNRLPDKPGHFVNTLAHTDDLIVACAEVGLTLDIEVVCLESTTGRVALGTLRDLLLDSLARFSMNQELQWTLEAFSRYIESARWINRFGQSFTLNDIAQALLGRPLGEGACLGIHNVHALAVLYRVAESYPELVPKQTVDQISSLLERISASLEKIAVSGQLWDSHWHDPSKVANRFDLFQTVAAIGHHFEWMAVVPPNLRPSVDTLSNTLRKCLELPKELKLQGDRDAFYLNLTHLCRGVLELFDVPRFWNS